MTVRSITPANIPVLPIVIVGNTGPTGAGGGGTGTSGTGPTGYTGPMGGLGPTGGNKVYYGRLSAESLAISANAFATLGLIFMPQQNLTISGLIAYLSVNSGTPTYKFSICSVTRSGTTFSINSQIYVSPNDINATGDNLLDNVIDSFAAPVTLLANTYYVILITGTSLATSTTAIPIYETTSGSDNGWANIPLVLNTLNSTAATAARAGIASLTPPTSGTLTIAAGTSLPNFGMFFSF